MSSYQGKGQAQLLHTNSQVRLWDNEVVPASATGTQSLSKAVQLERISRSFYPWGCSVEAVFGSAPGTFEIDIMGANDDNPNNYVQLGTITAVNSTNVGRYDMATNLWPKFVAAYMKTLGNATVPVTLTVTR